jgi:hypothetical protein
MDDGNTIFQYSAKRPTVTSPHSHSLIADAMTIGDRSPTGSLPKTSHLLEVRASELLCRDVASASRHIYSTVGPRA